MHKRSTLDRIIYQYGKRITKIWPTYPSRVLITQRLDGRPVVLKVEESDQWWAKLRNAGFELPDQKIPRKKRVADYYRSDYKAFGYAC